MDPLSMERAMMKNMIDKIGKSIDEWIAIVRNQKFNKHAEIVKFLKENYSFGHVYAHLIAKKSKTIQS